MTIPFSVVVDNLYFLCRAISSSESRSDIDRFTLAAANLIRSFGASARFWRVPKSVPVSHLVVPLSPFVPSELTSMRDRLEFVGSFGIYWKGLESLRTRQSADFRNDGTHADCQPGLPVLRAGRGCVKKRSIGALSIDRIVWNCAAPGMPIRPRSKSRAHTRRLAAALAARQSWTVALVKPSAPVSAHRRAGPGGRR